MTLRTPTSHELGQFSAQIDAAKEAQIKLRINDMHKTAYSLMSRGGPTSGEPTEEGYKTTRRGVTAHYDRKFVDGNVIDCVLTTMQTSLDLGIDAGHEEWESVRVELAMELQHGHPYVSKTHPIFALEPDTLYVAEDHEDGSITWRELDTETDLEEMYTLRQTLEHLGRR